MNILFLILQIVALVSIVMLHVAYSTYFERKVIGRMQMRMGPTIVGPYGLLQPIADGVKLFFKEDIIPLAADKVLFYAAPIVSLIAMIGCLAVLPFAEHFVLANIDIGLIFVFAMSSMSSYGVILAGWASNSKYSFLGGLRSMSQVISYEIAMGLSVVGVMMMAGSLNLNTIVAAQATSPLGMYLIPQFIGFFVFVIAMLAETNRAPFDLPEAETELVAGYCTEYSGIRFSLFFMAEYIGMMVMAAICVTCFLGGWRGPFVIPYVPFFWFLLKIYAIMFLFFWLRASLPRYRYDHLMDLGWKVLIPLALANIVITGIVKLL